MILPPIGADGTSAFNAQRGVVPVKFTLEVNGDPTCILPSATIAVFRVTTTSTQQVDEAL